MPNNIEQETWNVLNGLNLNSILLHYGKIIVTMTSWKNRIHNCANVIESILHGTLKPDVIFLNISSEEFPCLSDELPDDLMSLCMLNPTVKLNWVSGTNAKSMKKIFPILKYVSDNDIIIDIDDDIIFPIDFIRTRVDDFLHHNCRCAISGGGLVDNRNGRFYITGCSAFPKRAFDNWDKVVNDNIINTFNDDRTYFYLCAINGVKIESCSDFTVFNSIAKKKKCVFLDSSKMKESSMSKNHSFVFADEYDKIMSNRI